LVAQATSTPLTNSAFKEGWETPDWHINGWTNTVYGDSKLITTSTDWSLDGSRSLKFLPDNGGNNSIIDAIQYGNTLGEIHFSNIDPFVTHYLSGYFNFPYVQSMGLFEIRDRQNRPITVLETLNTGNGVKYCYYWFDYANDTTSYYNSHSITTNQDVTIGVHKIVISVLYDNTGSGSASITLGLWVDDVNLGTLTVSGLLYNGSVSDSVHDSQVFAPELIYAGSTKAIGDGEHPSIYLGNFYMDDLVYDTIYPDQNYFLETQPTPTETLTATNTSPTPSPSIPEFNIIIIVPLFIALILAVMFYKKKRKEINRIVDEPLF
jgi:hypothetical protein